MDIKQGTTGESPEKDVLPLLSQSKRKFVSLIWDDSNPLNWFIVFKDKESDDNVVLKLLISDVTEVLLEVKPSKSFKIYKSKDVIRLTPCGSSRDVVIIVVVIVVFIFSVVF